MLENVLTRPGPLMAPVRAPPAGRRLGRCVAWQQAPQGFRLSPWRNANMRSGRATVEQMPGKQTATGLPAAADGRHARGGGGRQAPVSAHRLGPGRACCIRAWRGAVRQCSPFRNGCGRCRRRPRPQGAPGAARGPIRNAGGRAVPWRRGAAAVVERLGHSRRHNALGRKRCRRRGRRGAGLRRSSCVRGRHAPGRLWIGGCSGESECCGSRGGAGRPDQQQAE